MSKYCVRYHDHQRETVYHHQELRPSSLRLSTLDDERKKNGVITKALNWRNLQATEVLILLDDGVEGGVNLAFSFTAAVQLRDSDIGPAAFSRAAATRYSVPIW